MEGWPPLDCPRAHRVFRIGTFTSYPRPDIG